MMLNTSFDHCLQSMIIRFRLLLMNLQVVQFQHGLQLFRLSYSQFVQTFENFIKWELLHRKMFVPSCIEFLNIVIPKNNGKYVGIVEHRIFDASDLEVVVDQVSDQFSANETVCFLSIVFLQTDLLLEVGVLDDLVQG